MSRFQTSTTLANRYLLSCMGDSMTDAYSNQVPMELYWSERVAAGLRALGCYVKSNNCGLSGDRTQASSGNPGMVNRMGQLLKPGVPSIGIIYGGVNDNIDGIATTATQANLESMVATLIAAGCTRNMIIGAHYLNWSSGGDTLSVDYVTWADLRAKQALAATAAGAVFVDLHASIKAGIQNGTALDGVVYTQGDHLFQFADSNVHYNTAGQGIIASLILAAIVAQSGWVSALQAQ